METLTDLAPAMLGGISAEDAIKNYTQAINKGLMKVMSKMGISTYMSYCGAQIFEAIGINRATIDKYFSGTPSSIEGIGVFEIAEGRRMPSPSCSMQRAPGASPRTRNTRRSSMIKASAT